MARAAQQKYNNIYLISKLAKAHLHRREELREGRLRRNKTKLAFRTTTTMQKSIENIQNEVSSNSTVCTTNNNLPSSCWNRVKV